MIRFINDILLSAPSIVVGLFVYTIVVAQMEHFSGWAGVIALALLQVPIVIRTTENMLKLVPDSLREAAYALGTPKWKMISAITLKASVSGIMTGILLAIARIAGETAPLLFTALSNQFWSTDMMQPIANLPVTIFKFAMSPFAEWQQLALGRGADHHPLRTVAEHSGARHFREEETRLIFTARQLAAPNEEKSQ